jgi:hypothetical protein
MVEKNYLFQKLLGPLSPTLSNVGAQEYEISATSVSFGHGMLVPLPALFRS